MLLIRDHYRDVFREIQHEYGEGEEYPPYEIDADCSLRRAIGYTRKNVIECNRYEHYQGALDEALEQLDFYPTNKKIVHLNLGSGPGLFSWVARDYMMLQQHVKDDSDIVMIGYDHSKNMVNLADLFRTRLPVEFTLKGYSDIDELEKKLSSVDFSDYHAIVTFDDILTHRQHRSTPLHNTPSLYDFARITQSLLNSTNSCILIVVNAFKEPNDLWIFRNTWYELEEHLNGFAMHLAKGSLKVMNDGLIYAHLDI